MTPLGGDGPSFLALRLLTEPFDEHENNGDSKNCCQYGCNVRVDLNHDRIMNMSVRNQIPSPRDCHIEAANSGAQQHCNPPKRDDCDPN